MRGGVLSLSPKRSRLSRPWPGFCSLDGTGIRGLCDQAAQWGSERCRYLGHRGASERLGGGLLESLLSLDATVERAKLRSDLGHVGGEDRHRRPAGVQGHAPPVREAGTPRIRVATRAAVAHAAASAGNLSSDSRR